MVSGHKVAVAVAVADSSLPLNTCISFSQAINNKMFSLATVVLALVMMTTAQAGLACFGACFEMCAMMGPGKFAAAFGVVFDIAGCGAICGAACAAGVFIPPGCYGEDTTFSVVAADGSTATVPVSQVFVGDKVLTIVNGTDPVPTTVLRTKIHPGTHPYIHLKTSNALDLSITSNHVMIVNRNATDLVLPANQLVPGDCIYTSTGTTFIDSIHSTKNASTFELVTSHGTVLSSHILTSTICSSYIDEAPKPLDKVLPIWAQDHVPAV